MILPKSRQNYQGVSICPAFRFATYGATNISLLTELFNHASACTTVSFRRMCQICLVMDVSYYINYKISIFDMLESKYWLLVSPTQTFYNAPHPFLLSHKLSGRWHCSFPRTILNQKNQ